MLWEISQAAVVAGTDVDDGNISVSSGCWYWCQCLQGNISGCSGCWCWCWWWEYLSLQWLLVLMLMMGISQSPVFAGADVDDGNISVCSGCWCWCWVFTTRLMFVLVKRSDHMLPRHGCSDRWFVVCNDFDANVAVLDAFVYYYCYCVRCYCLSTQQSAASSFHTTWLRLLC